MITKMKVELIGVELPAVELLTVPPGAGFRLDVDGTDHPHIYLRIGHSDWVEASNTKVMAVRLTSPEPTLCLFELERRVFVLEVKKAVVFTPTTL